MASHKSETSLIPLEKSLKKWNQSIEGGALSFDGKKSFFLRRADKSNDDPSPPPKLYSFSLKSGLRRRPKRLLFPSFRPLFPLLSAEALLKA